MDRPLERDEVLARADGGGDATRVLAGLLADRFSCRAFLPDPVPEETIRRLVSLAQLSPSWCNAQPWQLIVTSGAGTERLRAALFDHAARQMADTPDEQPDFPFPGRYEGVYQERRRETAWRLYESVGVPWGDRAASARQTLENFRIFGAPHVMLVTSPTALGVYAAIDCGIFVGSVLALAQSMGLATIAQAALATFPDFLRAYFGLPEDRRIVCGISFGFADTAHKANAFRTSRAPIESVVDWLDE